MTNLIEKNGKFYQECEVVMLENKNSKFPLNNLLLLHGKLSSALAGGEYRRKISYGAKAMELYFLSNEQIKEGDYMYNTFSGNIFQWVKGYGKRLRGSEYENVILDLSTCKKIVASTDSSLKIESSIGNQGTVSFNPLPRPSNSFIQKYVEEYNKGNKIEKCLIEMEEYNWMPLDDEFADIFYRPKVAPDNTITIKKKEEKTYKRDELIGYIRLAMQSKGYTPEYEVLEFIKENNL